MENILDMSFPTKLVSLPLKLELHYEKNLFLAVNDFLNVDQRNGIILFHFFP